MALSPTTQIVLLSVALLASLIAYWRTRTSAGRGKYLLLASAAIFAALLVYTLGSSQGWY